MKRIRRRTRNRILGVSSTLLVLMFGLFIVTVINKADSSVQKELLGSAYDYGIVADSLNQWYHMDTNFATNNYSFSEYDGMYQRFNATHYNFGDPGDVIATHVDNKLWADGKPVVLTAEDLSTDKGKNKFKFQASEDKYYNDMTVEQRTESELSAKVKYMLSSIKTKSEQLAKKKSEKDVDYEISDFEDRKLINVLTDDPVVYVDASELITDEKNIYNEKGDGCLKANKLYIKRKNNKQTIVLNFVYYDEEEEETPTPTPEIVEEVTPTPEIIDKEEATQAPEVEETITPTEEPTEEPTQAPEVENEDTSLLDVPVAKAAVKSYKINKKKSSDLELDVYPAAFIDGNGRVQYNDAPSTTEEAETALDLAEHVIYNIPYAKHVFVTAVAGTVVAPSARGKFGDPNHANCVGWLVMNEVYSNCGEWHYLKRKEISTPSPSPSEKVKESESPNPTSSATTTPEPTGTPKVTSTPEVTATPEATVTPIVTTTPTPVVTSTPPVIYYTFSPSPTETPEEETVSLDDEEVPLGPGTPEKPSEKTTTVLEDVPLAATVPETGDKVDPFGVFALMGISLVFISLIGYKNFKEMKHQ